jgi:hypothetical protein
MNKYTWARVDENKFYLWHTEKVDADEFKTLIAITDTAEKAHFLARAANEFKMVDEFEIIPSPHLPPEAWVMAYPTNTSNGKRKEI